MAAGREDLMIEQHAAIWAGACLPLAGVPMFWWWQIVDENDLYGRYTAVQNFMSGVDPRDITSKRVTAKLSVGEGGDKTLLNTFSAVCTASPEVARGYIYPVRFARSGEEPPVGEHLFVSVGGFIPALYRVEFFETVTGNPFAVLTCAVRTHRS